jgi:hypothetical protein
MPNRGATFSVGLRRHVFRPVVSIPLGRRPLNRGGAKGAAKLPTRARPLNTASAQKPWSDGVASGSGQPLGAAVPPLELVLLALVVFALCVAALAVLVEINGGTVTMIADSDMWAFAPFCPRYSLLLRFLGITSVLAASFLSSLQGGIGWLGGRTRLIMGLYFMASCFWFLVGFSSFTKFDLVTETTSPLVWFLCLGVAAGTRQVVSRQLGRIAGIAAWLIFPLMLYSLTKIPHYGRFVRVNPQVMYLSLLVWFAAYHLLATPGTAWLPRAARAIPLLACLLVAAFNQGRGWILQCLLAFLLLIARPLFLHETKAVSKVLKNGILAVLAVVAAFFLLVQFQPAAIQGLIDRATEDTRTGQYQAFFSQMGVFDLLTGKGPTGSYADPELGSRYEYFDNQYVWMLLKGGFLISLGYTVLVIVPGFRLFFRARNERDYAAAGTLILWSLALAGLSTYNAIGFFAQNYFILLLAGYCHWRLAAQMQVPRIPIRWSRMLPLPQMRRNVSPTTARA